jgi:uncharacterized protein GlcG (DUF336 family)
LSRFPPDLGWLLVSHCQHDRHERESNTSEEIGADGYDAGSDSPELQAMNVAVGDNSSDLKAFVRMEDAWVGRINSTIDKAYTSASFLMPTQDLAEMAQPG